MQHLEPITNDWMIDAKCGSLLIVLDAIAEQDDYEEKGSDFRLSVTLCDQIIQLIEISTVVKQERKAEMIKDMEDMKAKIVVQWALYIELKDRATVEA